METCATNDGDDPARCQLFRQRTDRADREDIGAASALERIDIGA
jgi:hypothetical protein